MAQRIVSKHGTTRAMFRVAVMMRSFRCQVMCCSSTNLKSEGTRNLFQKKIHANHYPKSSKIRCLDPLKAVSSGGVNREWWVQTPILTRHLED